MFQWQKDKQVRMMRYVMAIGTILLVLYTTYSFMTDIGKIRQEKCYVRQGRMIDCRPYTMKLDIYDSGYETVLKEIAEKIPENQTIVTSIWEPKVRFFTDRNVDIEWGLDDIPQLLNRMEDINAKYILIFEGQGVTAEWRQIMKDVPTHKENFEEIYSGSTEFHKVKLYEVIKYEI